MYHTKNDLSFNLAKLDYKALLLTSQIAFGNVVENISKYVDELRRDYEKKDGVSLTLNASWLRTDAQKLTTVTETMCALMGGVEREIVEIINKDPLTNEQKKNWELGEE